MLSKITHLTVFVHNQDEALTFYQKIGFAIHTDAQFGPLRWLTLCMPNQKDVEVALLLAESPEEKALVGKQGAGKPFITLESTDCLKDYEQLKKAGVTFLEAPAKQDWGVSTSCKDLYGNVIYICQPL